MFPRLIKDFNAFLNGEDFCGRVVSAKLPELKYATSDYSGGGMMGTTQIPMKTMMGHWILTPPKNPPGIRVDAKNTAMFLAFVVPHQEQSLAPQHR